MADTKLSALSQITAPAYNDRLYGVDGIGGTPASKYLNFGQLQLAITAVKTGAYSPNAGELVPCDVSATGANADIELTLPAAPTAGDIVGYFVEEEHASHTYNVDLVAAGATINGASYTGAAAGKWSLWIDGELLILRYINADIGWLVVHDGRIPHLTYVSDTTGTTATEWASSTWTKPDGMAAVIDSASLLNTTTDLIVIKRTNTYFVTSYVMTGNWLDDGENVWAAAKLNPSGADTFICASMASSPAASKGLLAFAQVPKVLTAADEVEPQYFHSNASGQAFRTEAHLAPALIVSEVL